MWGPNEAIRSLEKNENDEWTDSYFSSLKNGYMIATADLTQKRSVKPEFIN